MFSAMDAIQNSRPNTRDGGRPKSKGGSRPGTSKSKPQTPKTPQQKKQDEKDGDLTDDKIWGMINEDREYKRRKDFGFYFIRSVADVEQPTFYKRFVTPLTPDTIVTVGPVVGEVTTSSCKVLIECNSSVKVRCFARKIHNRANYDEDELQDLASHQQQMDVLKSTISYQKELELDSDPLVIADCQKEIDKLASKIKALGQKLEKVKTVVRTLVSEPNKPLVFNFEEGSLDPDTK
jgi:hypothetical protein